MKKISRVLGIIAIVFVFATLERFGFSAFGTRPDFILVVLIFIALREDFLVTLAATTVALFAVKPGPVLDFSTTILFLFILAAAFFRAFFSWREVVTNLFLVFSGTVLLFAVTEFRMIPTVFFAKEAFANLVAGGILFAIFSWAWHN